MSEHLKNEIMNLRGALYAEQEAYRVRADDCLALRDELIKKDRLVAQLQGVLEPFLEAGCEDPVRCRSLRAGNYGARLCRVCEAQNAIYAAGRNK